MLKVVQRQVPPRQCSCAGHARQFPSTANVVVGPAGGQTQWTYRYFRWRKSPEGKAGMASCDARHFHCHLCPTPRLHFECKILLIKCHYKNTRPHSGWFALQTTPMGPSESPFFCSAWPWAPHSAPGTVVMALKNATTLLLDTFARLQAIDYFFEIM